MSFIYPEAPLKFNTCENERSFQVRRCVMEVLKPKLDRCSFFCLSSKQSQLPQMANGKITTMLIFDQISINFYWYIYSCQHIWPHPNVLQRFPHPFNGVFTPERERIVENDARAAFYISCEKPIPSLVPIQYLAALFHLCRTFCANLLLSIVSKLFTQKVNPAIS